MLCKVAVRNRIGAGRPYKLGFIMLSSTLHSKEPATDLTERESLFFQADFSVVNAHLPFQCTSSSQEQSLKRLPPI